MLASGSGSGGVKDVVGTDVQFFGMGAMNGDQATPATSMFLGLGVGPGVLAGYFSTDSSPPPMIGGTGWTLVGSASETISLPAMVILTASSASTTIRPHNGTPLGGSVTVSSICVK